MAMAAATAEPEPEGEATDDDAEPRIVEIPAGLAEAGLADPIAADGFPTLRQDGACATAILLIYHYTEHSRVAAKLNTECCCAGPQQTTATLSSHRAAAAGLEVVASQQAASATRSRTARPCRNRTVPQSSTDFARAPAPSAWVIHLMCVVSVFGIF